MQHEFHQMTRRTALGLAGATAAVVAIGPTTDASAQTVGADGAKTRGRDDVSVLLNGTPPGVGSYTFPADVESLVLDNGLVRFAFGRDDAAGGGCTHVHGGHEPCPVVIALRRVRVIPFVDRDPKRVRQAADQNGDRKRAPQQ